MERARLSLIIGNILAAPGIIVGSIGVIAAPIWLIVGGDLTLVLIGTVTIFILNVVYNLLFALTLTPVLMSLEDEKHRGLKRALLITSIAQAIILFSITALVYFCVFNFKPSTGGMLIPYLWGLLVVLTFPLFIIASNSSNSSDLSFINTGIYGSGLLLSFIPLLFGVDTIPNMLWLAASLIVQVIIVYRISIKSFAT